jgi:hypothetical protein
MNPDVYRHKVLTYIDLESRGQFLQCVAVLLKQDSENTRKSALHGVDG